MANYIERSDIEAVFGVTNVNKWADLDNDNDSTKITNRIAAAIAWAESIIDDRLRPGPYEIPIAKGTSPSVTVPKAIVDVAANLAGVWLYENRGVQDFDPESGMASHRLEWNRARAERTLREILAGVLRLDANLMTTITMTPKAIENT